VRRAAYWLAALVLGLTCRDGLRPGPARAADVLPRPHVGPPLLLRLDGIAVRDRATAKERGGEATSYLLLGDDGGTVHWLAVTEARTIGGDHPADGRDVLNAVSPFRPSFLIAGPPTVLGRLAAAPPGTPLRLEGLVDRASRIYHLRRAVVGGDRE
jgi:hypothetical protein